MSAQAPRYIRGRFLAMYVFNRVVGLPVYTMVDSTSNNLQLISMLLVRVMLLTDM